MANNAPYGGFNFILELEGEPRASFSSVTGLGEFANELEHVVAGKTLPSRRTSPRREYDILSLNGGRVGSADLYRWYLETAQGKVQRKRGSLIVVDADGQQTMRWNFQSAWPTKWEGPDLGAKSTDMIVEILELTCEGLERA